MNVQNTILLLSCPDRSGLVAEVTAFVRDIGGNLLDLDQHTDPETNTLYMRVEWEPAGGATVAASGDGVAARFDPIARRFQMDWRLHSTGIPMRVALLVSKEGHCLGDLLMRMRAGELPMDVRTVIGNHDTLRPLAEAFDVPFRHLPVTRANRDRKEPELLALLEAERVELVVLARYMQILGSELVARFPNRIINVHHSFLPAFAGARPYHQAHQRGVKLIGATSHYVTDELDEGPIIEQVAERVTHRDSVGDLIRKGRDLERVALARAVRAHLQHRVLVYGNKTAVLA